MTTDTTLARELAARLAPELFSEDPHVAHRAASPFSVRSQQDGAIANAQHILDVLAQPEFQVAVALRSTAAGSMDRNAVIEECARVAEGFGKNREWVPGSLYEKIRGEVAAKIRTLSHPAGIKEGWSTDYGYLTQHHEITEKWVGIARLHLSRDRYGDARTALDRCVEDLKAILPAPPSQSDAASQGESA